MKTKDKKIKLIRPSINTLAYLDPIYWGGGELYTLECKIEKINYPL